MQGGKEYGSMNICYTAYTEKHYSTEKHLL